MKYDFSLSGICSFDKSQQEKIFSCTQNDKNYAFTMAEVLITLGVIGIVASMTIPQLIKNYQAKVLETALKKSYSNLSKAYLMTQNELGITNLKQTLAIYDSTLGKYPFEDEFKRVFYKNLGVANIADNYLITNYNKSATFYTGGSQNSTEDTRRTGLPRPLYILADGSSVGAMINSGQIYFEVDTNGPYQKPNRFGFDIFVFAIQDKQDIIKPIKMSKLYTEEELENQQWPGVAGNPCSIKSNQKSNGIGCSYYAINDINPDNAKSGYWKNLPK